MARSRIVNLANIQQFTAINILSDPGLIPGPIVIPNTVQIKLQWATDSGKSAFNILYGRAPGVPSPTVAQANAILSDLALAVVSSGVAAFQPLGSAGLQACILRSVHTINQPEVQSDVVGNASSSPDPALPSEVAIVLTERTALTGPANRGRIYIPQFAANAAAIGNTFSVALRSAMNVLGAAFGPAIAAGGYTHVLGQPARAAYIGTTGRQHPARPAGTVDVVDVICRDDHWDTQRRRGLK
jgi:hypothetical protein